MQRLRVCPALKTGRTSGTRPCRVLPGHGSSLRRSSNTETAWLLRTQPPQRKMVPTAHSLPFRRRPCFDSDMAALPISQSARLWFAWNEMLFHAGVTVVLRSSRFGAALWTQGTLPTAECWRMVGEKQLAAAEALVAAWAALPRGDPVRVANAALVPYRRHTRANARRLSRRTKK